MDVNNCKGHLYRAYNKAYVHNNDVCQKQGFRLLKRKSCSGCQICDFVYNGEALEIYFNEGYDNELGPIEDGAIYKLVITGGWCDEYGADSDFEFSFKKVVDGYGREVKDPTPLTDAQLIEKYKEEIKDLERKIKFVEEYPDDI
jgi:hypothetical protein